MSCKIYDYIHIYVEIYDYIKWLIPFEYVWILLLLYTRCLYHVDPIISQMIYTTKTFKMRLISLVFKYNNNNIYDLLLIYSFPRKWVGYIYTWQGIVLKSYIVWIKVPWAQALRMLCLVLWNLTLCGFHWLHSKSISNSLCIFKIYII